MRTLFRPAISIALIVTLLAACGIAVPETFQGRPIQDLLDPALDDLLFIQRKTYPPALAPLLRRRRRPVVYDMDDALDLPPPSLALGGSALRRYRRNFEATVAAADLEPVREGQPLQAKRRIGAEEIVGRSLVAGRDSTAAAEFELDAGRGIARKRRRSQQDGRERARAKRSAEFRQIDQTGKPLFAACF